MLAGRENKIVGARLRVFIEEHAMQSLFDVLPEAARTKRWISLLAEHHAVKISVHLNVFEQADLSG